ncbi:MAG TPA: sugar phosphate isomerase/epimerase family protein [Ktedonobacteraceae bacterium]|nr:sugar phosphate isomerase/epimerase family protein [Ktedonobacteraceae bacterium]
MKFGICTYCTSIQEIAQALSPSLLEYVKYVEVGVKTFLVPEQPQEAFDAQVREARLLPVPVEAANGLFPNNLKLIATPTQPIDQARIEHYVRTTLRRAEQAGIKIIVFGSGAARRCPADYDKTAALQQIAEHLERWSRWAREHGITIVLEPLSVQESNMLNTVAESGALVARISNSGARLLADTYHIGCNGEDPQTMIPHGSLLAHIHVAEVQGRRAPGSSGEDMRPTFSVLHHVGYNQRISIECCWQHLATQLPLAVTTLREQWEEARRQWVLEDVGGKTTRKEAR